MKIAIFGSTGLLGSNLVSNYLKKGIEIRSFSKSFSKNTLQTNKIIDFDNLNTQVETNFNTWEPDVIINTIALVNLQACEDNYKLAYDTNVRIAENLCAIAKKYDSYFIHISTDHFYNDKKPKHSEEDQVVLLNNYAKTKFEAEKEILSLYNFSLIVRTNIIGFRNNDIDSFFEWLLNSIEKQLPLSLYPNYFTSPISVGELSDILLLCYKKKLTGVYNISSQEVINKYSFGIEMAKKFGYSTQNVTAKPLQNSEFKIQRALTLGLDTSKIEKALKIKMPTIDETLSTLYKEYHE